MKITLCDDTKSDLIAITNILESYAKKNNFPIEIESNSDPVLLLNKVKMKPEEYRIFFLDIVMGDYNGVDLAAIIKRYCPDAVIVFTTTSKEFAIEAFGVRAFDYLLKPLNKKKVFECIENIVKEMKISLQTAFQIKTKDHSIITVDIKDISYIESLNRRIVFHKKDGDTIDTTSLRSKFIESIPFDYEKYGSTVPYEYVESTISDLLRGENDLKYINNYRDSLFVDAKQRKIIKYIK